MAASVNTVSQIKFFKTRDRYYHGCALVSCGDVNLCYLAQTIHISYNGDEGNDFFNGLSYYLLMP